MFPVHKLLCVEMLRDGGSLSATFEIGGGREFELFIPIAETMRLWREPVLVAPEQSVPVPWAQARQALAEMSALASALNEIESSWLRQMIAVALHEGRPPPGAL